MEYLEITKVKKDGEELFKVRDVRTELTVFCDENSLAITLNMMGAN